MGGVRVRADGYAREGRQSEVSINWTQLQLPGGTAFLACFLGQYGFGYDARMNAYARLVPALKARAEWFVPRDSRHAGREVVA